MTINKINKLITTTTNKVFDVNVTDDAGITANMVFFADVQNTTEIDSYKKHNEHCLMQEESNGNKQIIHNMYASKDNFYKSAIFGINKAQRSNTTYDFQNITNHKLSSELQHITKVDNFCYGLEEMSRYGRYAISNDIYSWISSNNGCNLPKDNNIKTTIYNKPYIVSCLENDITIDSVQAISIDLDNIQYNMLYEIPGNIYNDYQSGNIAANTYKTKNQYSSTYDMMHTNGNILTNARQYIGIGSCGKQVFLKYTDDLKYENASSTPTQSSGSLLDRLTYEKVELIDQMNRFKKLIGHSTNLYSLLVYTNLLDKTNLPNEKDRNLIEHEIQNNVRLIAEKLVPAQAQLLSVIVKEY